MSAMPIRCSISKCVISKADLRDPVKRERIMADTERVSCEKNSILTAIMEHYNHDIDVSKKIPLLDVFQTMYHVKLVSRSSKEATFEQSCVLFKSNNKYEMYNPRRVVVGFA